MNGCLRESRKLFPFSTRLRLKLVRGNQHKLESFTAVNMDLTKCLLAALLGALVFLTRNAQGEVTISGEDTLPPGPPTNNDGEVIEVQIVSRPPSGRSSKAIIGYPQPSFCPYEDKVCPSAVSSTEDLGTALDCMKKCKKIECAFFTHSGSTCGFAMGGKEACGTEGPSGLTQTPGTTVYIRKFGIPDPKKAHAEQGLSPTCPGGVGPVGLPEDDLSSHFCETIGKYCPAESGALMYSIFAATVYQCKSRCTSYEACFMAVWVRDAPNKKRMCHMFSRPCKASELKDDEPGVTSTTLFRLDIAGYRLGKKDWDNSAAFCPPGATYYRKDLGPPYTNKFCMYPMAIQCPEAEGDMYNQGQNKDADSCLKTCAGYPTCGYAFSYDIVQYDGTVKTKCNMKDSPICSEKVLTSSPAPAQYLKDENKSPAIPERDFPRLSVYIRMKESDNGLCPGATVPDPNKVPWQAKFCCFYDGVCPESAVDAAARTTVPAKDLSDCLTKCHKDPAGACKSAVFSGGQCTLLTGKCTQEQMTQVLFKKYYYKLSSIDEKCPTIKCPARSSAQDVSMCPDTCKDPNASKNCDYITKRCVCDLGYLDNDGICVRKEDCPVNDCPPLGVSVPTMVADTSGSTVHRILDVDSLSVGAPCGPGATIQIAKPCPNTCGDQSAQDQCFTKEEVKSCQCTAADTFFDPATRLCVPANTCPQS